ncbi:hypothetical protein KI688_010917 [Linnemannia hyalina]|uniref:Nucleoporin Nup159/Nup146 N-terminal domain-containing protein n=1 Tax=Linnemannia hyalina TaxID=64524 RepID=A0A9P7XWH2_9FUNG|nr:hypothetical protein KI688_010917 [Linnemannia hyalina]
MAEPKIEEVDVDFTLCTDIAFKQLKNSVELTLSDRLPDEIAANGSIFVVSNTYGYFIAGQNEGFLIDKLSSLRSAFENGEVSASNDYNEAARVEISGETISHIRLSADELTVIVGLRGGLIHLYSVTKLLAKAKGAKPVALLDLGSEILDIRPNPAIDQNRLIAVLLDNRTIRMINMEDGSTTVILDKHKYTAMAWSSKGKQIMCGTENGLTTIAWLETAVFIVVYTEQPEDDGTPSFISDFCVISKVDKTKPTKFTRYRELCYPMPNDICGVNYYVSSSLKNLSKNYKEFMVAGYSASTDIATIARGQDGEWMLLDLPEVDRPMVTGSDPCMLGMAIDLTATKPLEPLEEEGPEVPAAPILYVYNNHGQLSAYNILELPIAKQGLPNGAMVQPKALPQTSSSTKATPAAKANPVPKTAPKAASATPSVARVAAPTPKVSFGAPASAFGSSPSSPSATFRSFAPNPVVNPNPAFQQNTAAPPKPLGTMQKILQENDPPLRIVRKKSVADAPSAPAPKVSPAMDALSRQLENTYLAMTEELKTLHSHVRDTEELVKAREHVFGELDQFMLVTEKRIKAAEKTKVLAESVSKDFASLQTDLVKEEIGKLLKAREDPSLLEKVLTSELNPVQAAMQDQMTRTIETIDSRLRDLEKHVEDMNTEANKLRQGQYTEYHKLDSIRRTIRHISTVLISRQSDLDQLSNDLDNLAITEPISPRHGSTSNVSAKGSVTTQNKDAFHLKSFSSISGNRSTEQSKAALARELRRVFAADSKSTAILNAPSSTAAGTPLSVLPKLKEVEFVPVFEPRRSERKKRLAATVTPQPEVPATATPPPSVPASVPASATPVQSFGQSGPALGSPTASATATVVSTLSPAFGFKAASSPVPAPAFGIPQTSSPFGSTPMPAKAAPGFDTPSLPNFGATPPAAAPMSFGAPKTPTFPGFQVPKSGSSAAPAFPGFIPKSELSAAPVFSSAPSFSAAPTSQPAWSLGKTSTSLQSTGFAGFQAPSSVGTAAKVTPAPASSFAGPVQQEEEEEEYEGEEEQDEPQEDDEGEYEDEEDRHYNQARYEHDGQVYDLEDDGSEPETWGSDTDQRDFDQGEEDEENEEEEGPYEEEDGDESEGEATPAPVSSEKKDPTAKSAWTAPGFSFPATAPATSAPAADSSKPAFSFFTAAAKQPKDSEVKAAHVAQSPFGTTGANTFGSTTTFAFGAPQAAASTPAPVSAFGQKHSAPSTAVPKSTPTAREPVKTQESDDEEEDLPDEEQEDSDVEGEQDDEQEELGSEAEEDGDFDEDGSEVEEEEDAEDDSDKESALTAVQREGSFAPSTASGAKSSNLESSGLDFSKAGFGGSVQKGGDTASPFAKTASSASSQPLFGATPAFGSASDAKATPEKSLDMPFVKLPRTRKASRDSLDSNTTDDEDQAVPDSEPSSPVLGFGKTSKGTSGGLDSFNLSLGSEQAKTDKKPAAAWGESSFSSWGSASQTSVAPPTGAWGSSSLHGSSQPASSASPFAAVSTSGPGASASPFAAAAAAPSALTSTPASSATTTTSAWGTGGGFGQTSTLGSGFGGNTTGFGQTSQAPATTVSGFGQASQPGSTTGFGQGSTLGAGTGFGQTSTAGSGFGQTSTHGAGSAFGQASTLGAGTGFGQASTLGAGTGFGQTSQLGSGSAFGQASQVGGGTAFGQKSQMGGGFGQTAFGQPSQIAAGAFGTPAASGIASASTQSNFGSFASSGTNAFAAASQSKVNALDQQAGGSVFGSGGGFGDSSTSTFGSGGGGGGFGGGNTGFGDASTGFGGSTNNAFGGANNAFGGASNNTGGFNSFGGAATGGGGGFGASTGQSAFGAAAGQGGSVFGQGQANTGFGSNQTNTGFGTSQANINPNKPAFSSFR